MIHFRFIKDNKIVGYGNVNNLSGWVTFSTWIKSGITKLEYPCDLIERGIKVRGEVWYEGDRFMYDGLFGTLKWHNDCGMFQLDLDDYPYKTVTINMMDGYGTRRIGSVYEGE